MCLLTFQKMESQSKKTHSSQFVGLPKDQGLTGRKIFPTQELAGNEQRFKAPRQPRLRSSEETNGLEARRRAALSSGAPGTLRTQPPSKAGALERGASGEPPKGH